ncbi:MAG: DUF2461 domain-containing protein [Paludibacteraceae bacterium]|nr:DUF2461 domain-containing protein [Paludibacteraceae bacterium]
MNAKNVLDFQRKLAVNNNRPWFTEHKGDYLTIKADLEAFTQQWIDAMAAEVDPELGALKPSDCMYRIYRDTRFSNDKTPYKHWIGIILAPHGGRKSINGCYYLHFEPGHCQMSAGVWCPTPELVKALRQDIYDNADELADIFSSEAAAPFFCSFDEDGQQKKIPAGFPKDFAHPEWLARRSFTVTTPLTDEEMCSADLFERLMAFCHAARPLNQFLDYTIEEHD